MPERIQLRRTAGWRKPESAIVVARPSKWGNPFRLLNQHALIDHLGREHLAEPGTARALAVRLYREALTNDELDITTDDVFNELHGRDLACWCPAGVPCHGDVLLYVANSPIFHPTVVANA